MTTEQIFTTIDKSEWGPGPWTEEPDKVVWVDPVTKFDCMIHRGPAGALCGYVGVGPDHPLHGNGYDDVDPYPNVHGGLTYANACQPAATEENGICHVPAPGRPDDVWWFGFDCSHCWDLMPGMRFRERAAGQLLEANGMPNPFALTEYDLHDVYRDLAYVRAEVTRLASQLYVPGSVPTKAAHQKRYR